MERLLLQAQIMAVKGGENAPPLTRARGWRRIQTRNALPRRNFHSTRHTSTSLLLAEGIGVKVVQEVLGHSLLSTTADLYTHLFPAAFEEAAAAMDRALSS